MATATSSVSTKGVEFFTKHHDILTKATEAIASRNYVSPFPEIPSGKIYGETAAADGQSAFESCLEKSFDLDQPSASGEIGSEVSPYGLSLGVKYPKTDVKQLVDAAKSAMDAWRHTDVDTRTGICLEILTRLNKRSFELAHAVMHTTGQGFMMSFQAGGPHAQDRGLEALAFAHREMTRFPAEVRWEKRVGKTETEGYVKTQRIVPRGVAVIVACSTFPTWNTYPALFANLATGNAVIVKPHPGAILPLAITVKIVREVIAEAGFDPNLVTLAADDAGAPITKDLVTHPDVRLVDYTGSTSFGKWIEENAKQAAVFTEKAGVNSVVLDSVDDIKRVSDNLAFSLCLYSGQMCTSPQNIFIPQYGIKVGDEKISYDDVAGAIVKATDKLLSDPKMACEILGAIQNEQAVKRISDASNSAKVLRPSSAIEHPMHTDARVHSPLILGMSSSDTKVFMDELFGPIACLIATKDTTESIELAAQCARETGSITSLVHTTDPDIEQHATETLTSCGVPVSVNLTGQKLVNHAAAFSDFHVSGLNPSGNATFCDSAFVANRFRVVQSCRPA